MDGIVGKVSAFGPSGWQCGKSFSEVQCWNRIEAVSQMKTPWPHYRLYKFGAHPRCGGGWDLLYYRQ